MTHRNWLGYRTETIAAEYETDEVLAAWMAEHPNTYAFPPEGHYFWAAWGAECVLRYADDAWRKEHVNELGKPQG